MPKTANEFDGIIGGLHKLDAGYDCPIHIAAATLKPDKWGRKRVVSGKGLSEEEAISCCLFEAIERQYAIFNDSIELLHARPEDLRNEAVPLQSLLLISDDQYQKAPIWNDTVAIDHRLPLKPNNRHSIAWVKAESIFTQNTIFVPAAHCFLGYPNAIEEGFPIPDSSGLASGNSSADAIGRGLLELVERDAVSIWWYGRVKRPEMHVDREKFALWKPFEEWIKRSGRTFWILDLTHDLAIPVAAAISCDATGGNLSIGFAAAKTHKEAAESAMGELVQFEVTKNIRAKSGSTPINDFVSWCMSANAADYQFICPDKKTSAQSCALSNPGTINLENLRKNNLDILVVNLSPADRKNKAVRVIVPGLRAIWPRFSPGRLYDVPYKLGWHERRLAEAELNPMPILY